MNSIFNRSVKEYSDSVSGVIVEEKIQAIVDNYLLKIGAATLVLYSSKRACFVRQSKSWVHTCIDKIVFHQNCAPGHLKICNTHFKTLLTMIWGWFKGKIPHRACGGDNYLHMT